MKLALQIADFLSVSKHLNITDIKFTCNVSFFSLKVYALTIDLWKCKVKIFHVHFGYFEHCDKSNNLVIPLQPRIIKILLYLWRINWCVSEILS